MFDRPSDQFPRLATARCSTICWYAACGKHTCTHLSQRDLRDIVLEFIREGLVLPRQKNIQYLVKISVV